MFLLLGMHKRNTQNVWTRTTMLFSEWIRCIHSGSKSRPVEASLVVTLNKRSYCQQSFNYLWWFNEKTVTDEVYILMPGRRIKTLANRKGVKRKHRAIVLKVLRYFNIIVSWHYKWKNLFACYTSTMFPLRMIYIHKDQFNFLFNTLSRTFNSKHKTHCPIRYIWPNPFLL